MQLCVHASTGCFVPQQKLGNLHPTKRMGNLALSEGRQWTPAGAQAMGPLLGAVWFDEANRVRLLGWSWKPYFLSNGMLP